MPVFQHPSYFVRDSPSSADSSAYSGRNVPSPAPEAEVTTSHLPFLGNWVSTHIYAVALVALTAVVLVRFASAKRAESGATAKPRGWWQQPFPVLLSLLWVRISQATGCENRANRGSSAGVKDPKRNASARGFGLGGACEKDTPQAQQHQHQGLDDEVPRHLRTRAGASGGLAGAAPTGAASAGATGAPSSAPAPVAAAPSAVTMHRPESRVVSANRADLTDQRLPPAAEKALERPFPDSARLSLPPTRTSAPDHTDGGAQDSPIMDGDSWPGASPHALPGNGATSADAGSSDLAAVRDNAVVATDGDDRSHRHPTHKMSRPAVAFGCASTAGSLASEAGAAGAGASPGGRARGHGGPGLGLGSEPRPSTSSVPDLPIPRQFQIVSRPPMRPLSPPAPSASATVASYTLGEGRRLSYAAAIPPGFETASRHESFIHQPNPDYMKSSAASGDGSASGSRSSGLESGLSPESTSTSTELVSPRKSSSPSTPWGRRDSKALSIDGGDSFGPTAIPGGNSLGGTGPNAPRWQPNNSVPLASSFPSSATPMLPPPPPPVQDDYGHDSTFFSGPSHLSVTSHHGGDALEGELEIDVHGEVASGVDGAGASWKRHTRVYGGGVCLACLANGGGFYGDTVPLEERRPR